VTPVSLTRLIKRGHTPPFDDEERAYRALKGKEEKKGGRKRKKKHKEISISGKERWNICPKKGNKSVLGANGGFPSRTREQPRVLEEARRDFKRKVSREREGGHMAKKIPGSATPGRPG